MKKVSAPLQKRVLDARKKRNERLRTNYHLCRGFGYTAEESSILMNQGWKNIIANAYQAGMYWKTGTMPEDYTEYALTQAVKYRGDKPKDVTEIGDYI